MLSIISKSRPVARQLGSFPLSGNLARMTSSARLAQIIQAGKATTADERPIQAAHMQSGRDIHGTSGTESLQSAKLSGDSTSHGAGKYHPVTAALNASEDEFWRKVPVWENTSCDDFLSYRWGVSLSHVTG